MNLETGKLYKINEYFWFLFPTKEAAAAAAGIAIADAMAMPSAPSGARLSYYWSRKLGCNISSLSEGDTIIVVDVSDIHMKVINQEGLTGWINFPANKPGAEPWKVTKLIIPLTPAAGSANMQA